MHQINDEQENKIKFKKYRKTLKYVFYEYVQNRRDLLPPPETIACCSSIEAAAACWDFFPFFGRRPLAVVWSSSNELPEVTGCGLLVSAG